MAVEKTERDIRALVTSVSSGEICLPEIQRAYVWKPTQIAKLVESLSSSVRSPRRLRSSSWRASRAAVREAVLLDLPRHAVAGPRQSPVSAGRRQSEGAHAPGPTFGWRAEPRQEGASPRQTRTGVTASPPSFGLAASVTAQVTAVLATLPGPCGAPRTSDRLSTV